MKKTLIEPPFTEFIAIQPMQYELHGWHNQSTIMAYMKKTHFAQPFHLMDRGEVSNGFGGSSMSRGRK